MRSLPIDESLPEIVTAVRATGAVVIVAPPGAGKTTRVPVALAARRPAREGEVVVLQPRRLAARAAAVRIADEQGWKVGKEVGYQVRYESRTSKETLIRVVTEGILIRRLQRDPFLEGVNVVVLDEFHERSIQGDLALALVREIRESAREELAVVVMSATLDPGPVAEFLRGCPIVEVTGRMYPVEVSYRPQARDLLLEEGVASAVRGAWREGDGHTLVFLPGIGEIRRCYRALEAFAAAQGALLVPLHGSLSLSEQQRAIGGSERRKIILSTNVAETSVTIDGVDLVVDSGYARLLRNDPRHGIDRLETRRISRQSAEQRAGRAGRQRPGKAIRLWALLEHARLPVAESAEIRRVDLAATVLELRAWGVPDPTRFGWYEAPEEKALGRAEALLSMLGAIREEGGPLTATGKRLVSLPLHPRLGCILLEAHRVGLLDDGALVVAFLEERDILAKRFLGNDGERGSPSVAIGENDFSDLLLRLELFREAERADFRGRRLVGLGLEPSAVRAVARLRDDVLRTAKDCLGPEPVDRDASGGSDDEREALLSGILLAGYPDRVVRRRQNDPNRGRMVGGYGVVLSRESVVREGELFIAVDLDDSVRRRRGEALVRLASAVSRRTVEQMFSDHVSEITETWYDDKTEKVRSTVAVSYRDLPLEEPREKRPPAREAEALLTEVVRRQATELLASDERLSDWLSRVRFLREAMPELDLPTFDSAGSAEILGRICAGKTSLREVRREDLLGHLKAELPFELLSAVDAHAPESIRVPSGSRIRLRYERGKPPALAVRVQELFGLSETPRVAAGRVRVVLHLLGPNFRPVQVTQDLRSFWENTYQQVRKDLRGRYPKHAWPEDPWSATPERQPRRKGRRSEGRSR